MILKKRTKIVLIVALLGFVLYASLLGARVLDYQFSVYDAAYAGDTAAVLVLLPLSNGLNTGDVRGLTPLGSAAMGGSMNVVKTLLQLGSDPDGDSSDPNHRPVVLAAKDGQEKVVRYLLDRGATYNVDVAIILGDVDFVRKALESGSFSADYQYYDGQPALAVAVTRNDLEMARVLLENGANPEKTGSARVTLSGWARNLGFEEMAELIESYVTNPAGSIVITFP